VKTFASNLLKNNGAASQKPSNPRRRAKTAPAARRRSAVSLPSGATITMKCTVPSRTMRPALPAAVTTSAELHQGGNNAATGPSAGAEAPSISAAMVAPKQSTVGKAVAYTGDTCGFQ
jgi:hypothetical protein